MTTSFTVKVGTNRGYSRVWLEGKRLAINGWLRGDHYSQTIEPDRIILTKDDNGPKKIAGKTKEGQDVPIIDLIGNYLDFLAGGRALVEVTTDSIVVSKEPTP